MVLYECEINVLKLQAALLQSHDCGTGNANLHAFKKITQEHNMFFNVPLYYSSALSTFSKNREQ